MVRSKDRVAQYAEMLAALGTEPRLRIIRLLLSYHPMGMVVGDIQKRLGIAPSTLSHHLEKLKHQRLVRVRRERQFLWYSANAAALEGLLSFLFEECCARSGAVAAATVVSITEKPAPVPESSTEGSTES